MGTLFRYISWGSPSALHTYLRDCTGMGPSAGPQIVHQNGWRCWWVAGCEWVNRLATGWEERFWVTPLGGTAHSQPAGVQLDDQDIVDSWTPALDVLPGLQKKAYRRCRSTSPRDEMSQDSERVLNGVKSQWSSMITPQSNRCRRQSDTPWDQGLCMLGTSFSHSGNAVTELNTLACLYSDSWKVIMMYVLVTWCKDVQVFSMLMKEKMAKSWYSACTHKCPKFWIKFARSKNFSRAIAFYRMLYA